MVSIYNESCVGHRCLKHFLMSEDRLGSDISQVCCCCSVEALLNFGQVHFTL